MVALAVKLALACQHKPGLEVFGHRAVQQGALGVAGSVGFGGFGNCSRPGMQRGMLVPTRVPVKTLWQWMGRALHRATPVWSGLATRNRQ